MIDDTGPFRVDLPDQIGSGLVSGSRCRRKRNTSIGHVSSEDAVRIQGADSGAEVPVLVPNGSPNFALFCMDLHDRVQIVTGKSGGRKRKETPRELGVSGINAAF